MRSKNIRFLVILACLVVVMIGLTFFVKTLVPHFVTPFWSPLILLFTIISIVVYFMTMKVKSLNDYGKFTAFYMGSIVVKLLVYLAVIVTYVMMFPDDKKAFICTFLAYYLCYTIFETCVLTKSN